MPAALNASNVIRVTETLMLIQVQGLGSLVMRQSLSSAQKKKQRSKTQSCRSGVPRALCKGGFQKIIGRGPEGLADKNDKSSAQHKSREPCVTSVSLSSDFREIELELR